MPSRTNNSNANRGRRNTGTQAPVRSWDMYPSKHDAVSQLLGEEGLSFNFHYYDDDSGCERDYDTTIMGLFTCCNTACNGKKWSSKHVAITIRMYPGAKYNARVYNQRCKGCKKLSTPKLDNSYAERVANRLKVWSGVHLELPYYIKTSKSPHESSLCEGCKHGRCSEV